MDLQPAPASEEPFWSGPLEYRLPAELIAQRPCSPRDASRLLVLERGNGAISHTTFSELPRYLEPGDLVVANDSRVLPARLYGRKDSGGQVELLVLGLPESGPVPALSRSSKPLRPGQRLNLEGGLSARVESVAGSGKCLIDLGPENPRAVLERIGHIPLPPYIRSGSDEEEDRDRYQTIYADDPGSVAAPTAGLHFSADVLAAIDKRGAEFRTLTLHVGPGTFTPVRSTPEAHEMEAEHCRVTANLAVAVNEARVRGSRIVAIGTTSVRTLESAAAAHGPGPLAEFDGMAELFIRPGHRFRFVDSLLTNFHLPNSTLLCLVMAFAGVDLARRAYKEAVQHRYRFYSYGDAMLIL